MGRRIILMLSMLVASIAILLSSDLVSSQMIYSELDEISASAGYFISKDGGITQEVVQYVKKEVNANIYCAMDDCSSVKKGDTYFYIVEKSFTPIVLGKKDSLIQIKRSVVIGLYSNL